MTEIWKDINGYAGYQVSNFGRVRTHNKVSSLQGFNAENGKTEYCNIKAETSQLAAELDTELIYGKMESLIQCLWHELPLLLFSVEI